MWQGWMAKGFFQLSPFQESTTEHPLWTESYRCGLRYDGERRRHETEKKRKSLLYFCILSIFAVLNE